MSILNSQLDADSYALGRVAIYRLNDTLMNYSG